MTNQNNWEEEFIQSFFAQSGSLSVEELLDVKDFICKVQAEAERRGYSEGYSDALNACKTLIAEGTLHGIAILEKALNTPPND